MTAIPSSLSGPRGLTMKYACFPQPLNDREALVRTSGPGNGTEHEPERDSLDAREYARRLRSLPVEQVVGDVLFSLLNAANFKLGRRDARLLIDLTAVAHQHARAYLDGELAERIDQVLGQLRLGQVTAEGRASRQDTQEENDLDRIPAPPPTAPAQ
jgi:hypothetical protein